ncbi:hypothetical protein MSPP1_000600 [Malassezia sp. CBS 17886]|nr:hypothetical protein MSPP1_000600 [Malassezia sp. CBS 17886]
MSEGSLLDRLDRLPKLRRFDAFPKAQPVYVQRSSHGGAATVLVLLLMAITFLVNVHSYLVGSRSYSFSVDDHLGKNMQVNLDMTVATPCQKVSVDLRDAAGDRIHFLDDDLAKDNTIFRAQHRRAFQRHDPGDLVQVFHSASRWKEHVMRGKAKKGQPAPIVRPRDKHSGFAKTYPLVAKGSACRIYGSILVKKTAGNLHVSLVDPAMLLVADDSMLQMNASHVIHEFGFGPYFTNMAEPLESSMEITTDPRAVYQYFVSVVPTRYISARGQTIETNQYSVNDYVRNPNGPIAFPGIYLKYDLEPLTMTVHERTQSFVSFLVRLLGTMGGLWLCSAYALRVVNRVVIWTSGRRAASAGATYSPMAAPLDTFVGSSPLDPHQSHAAHRVPSGGAR